MIFDHLDRQQNARAVFYPDGVPGYEEVGNTAFITFDSFVCSAMNGEDYYGPKDPLDFGDEDTVGLIIKAHELINRESSPIENVVLDLSANTGGMDNAAVAVISWFLGEAALSQTDNMTGAMCTSVYRADINRDRVFDEKDTVADKNLFCLVSPCSFSCGNLAACMFKESGKVTLLGRTSGGGSCSVMSVSSAWGTSFQISSNQRMSFLKNGSYYDVDRGADPDFVIPTPKQYYDRAALTDYINSLCW
jgi:C-terminal processing protease CtpA/Prc